MSLYEYWGIADTCAAHSRNALRRASRASVTGSVTGAGTGAGGDSGDESDETTEGVATSGAGGGGVAGSEGRLAAAVERWFVRAATRPRGAGLDAQRVRLDRSEDGLIWIVFRRAPLRPPRRAAGASSLTARLTGT